MISSLKRGGQRATLLERWAANTSWTIHVSHSSKSFPGEPYLRHSFLSFQLYAARSCWNIVSIVDLLGNVLKKWTKSRSHKVISGTPEVRNLGFLLAGKLRSQPWVRKGSDHQPSVVIAQPASCQLLASLSSLCASCNRGTWQPCLIYPHIQCNIERVTNSLRNEALAENVRFQFTTTKGWQQSCVHY